MKKIYPALAIIIASLMLTACSSNYIEITDKESDAIAQYCAHLLLKYDKNKVAQRKLLDVDELEDYYEELHKNDPTPTPTEMAEPTAEPTSEPEVTPTPEDITDVPTAVPTEPELPKAESLTELYAKEDFTVEYKTISVTQMYYENEYSSISAKDGESIAVIFFNIRNIGDADQKFVSSDSKVGYALYCVNGNIYTPTLSMLGNDIQFLNDLIEKDEEYEAVLLFFIDAMDLPVKLRAEDGESGKIFDIDCYND